MLVAASVGARLRVGRGGRVSVMVGSRVKVVSGVGVISEVGETTSMVGEFVADSGRGSVDWIVAVGTGVRVGDGEGVGVAGTQAVRKASRMQVR
jgi:hypothetical protein